MLLESFENLIINYKLVVVVLVMDNNNKKIKKKYKILIKKIHLEIVVDN
jgi:hypothetical protein